MSNSYYEKGAKHYDHHKELHIDTVNGGDIGKLISAFFKDESEAKGKEYEEYEEVLVKETDHEPLENKEQNTPKSSPFAPAVIDAHKAPEVIILLRQLMEGKTKPKDVLMPVRAAMEAGVIRRPTWDEFCQGFGSWRLKSKASFSDYTNPDKQPYAGSDFEVMTAQFRRLVTEGQ